jgi:coproporphyrinogen III oxidase-like Fe-S oxidoreductase
MKLGRLDTHYFQTKFGVDVRERFAGPLRSLQARGFLSVAPDAISATRAGLLCIDTLLEGFFRDEHRNARYA